MTVNTTIPFVMIGIYILIVFYLSFRVSIKQRLRKARGETLTFEEYYTAGKSMPGWFVTLVILVTFYSGSTFTGRVGFAYNYGVSMMAAIPGCVMTGVYMFFLSEKIWPLSKKYRLSTLSDLMELRFQNKTIKTVVSSVIVFFNITWLILEIKTLGYIVNVVSNGAISREVGSFIGFSIIILYVVTGGIRSVAAVDSFSAIVMLAGSTIALVWILARFYHGSVFNVFEVVQSIAPDRIGYNIFDPDYGWKFWISAMLLDTSCGLVYPANYMQICLAKSTREIKKTAIGTAFSGPWLAIISLIGFAALGLTSMGYSFSNPESALLEIANFTGSAVLVGIVATFIFAAALGTLDSTLMGLSGLISNDIIGNIRRINKNEPMIGEFGDDPKLINQRVEQNAAMDVRAARITCVILGLLAYFIGLMDLPVMVVMIFYSSQGLVQLVPVVLASLYWKKITPAGAMSSIAVGVGSFILLERLGLSFGGFWIGLPCLVLNLVTLYVVSTLTCKKYYEERPQYKIILRDFFEKDAVEKYLEDNISNAS